MNTQVARPWGALWAMLLGYFMTLIDWTAVSVANPSLMAALHTDYEAVIWVTSAYLLGFAVPLLVAGRLGDRFGPKNLYLIGLAIFTDAPLPELARAAPQAFRFLIPGSILLGRQGVSGTTLRGTGFRRRSLLGLADGRCFSRRPRSQFGW
jgi:MFS family permease